MLDTDDPQPIFSYVDIGGLKCLQVLTPIESKPIYHSKVVEITDHGIKIRAEVITGVEIHVFVLWSRMFLVGEGVPIRSYTYDCLQANIYEIEKRTDKMPGVQNVSTVFKVKVVDLYGGTKMEHLNKELETLEAADLYAREKIKLF